MVTFLHSIFIFCWILLVPVAVLPGGFVCRILWWVGTFSFLFTNCKCPCYIYGKILSNQWEIIIIIQSFTKVHKCCKVFIHSPVYSQSHKQCFIFSPQVITVWSYMWRSLQDMDIYLNTRHMACLMITEYSLMTAPLMYFHIPLANWNLCPLSGEILGIAQTLKQAISTCFQDMLI